MNGITNIRPVPSEDTQPAKSVRVREYEQYPPRLRTVLCIMATVIGVAMFAAPRAFGGSPPDFKVIAKAINDYFDSLSGRQPTDLISQNNVTSALAAAEKAGWKVPHGDEVVKKALPDNSFLVREFAKTDGRKFMRKLAKTQGAYNRLDRLSTIPNGQSYIRTLIRDPGGETMIEYMATTAGGRSLGRMMGGLNQGGVDLNTPTNRIYTSEDLIAVLSSIYTATTVSTP